MIATRSPCASDSRASALRRRATCCAASLHVRSRQDPAAASKSRYAIASGVSATRLAKQSAIESPDSMAMYWTSLGMPTPPVRRMPESACCGFRGANALFRGGMRGEIAEVVGAAPRLLRRVGIGFLRLFAARGCQRVLVLFFRHLAAAGAAVA